MRFFLHLSYQGTKYSGWQAQKTTDETVQQKLEYALSKLIKNPIKVHGCGRTDAGVHASQYFAHVELPSVLNSEAIQLLNFNLPEDIVVYECIAVDPKANAQKDAASRTYSYYFHVEKQVFLNESSFFYTGSPMNFNLLEAGLEFISKQIDFSILCKRPEQYKNADCFITDANLTKLNTFQWVIEITANRFLQGMMRLIVGNLFEIAAEKRELAELKACFSKNTRPEFYTSAYPQGLHLSKVEYPYLTRKNRTQRLN